VSRAHDCFFCNGTGLDEASWDGRCPFCDGTGEVADERDICGDADDDGEDE